MSTNETVYKTLWMYDNFYFIRRKIKKTAGFNYFETFICKCCTINRNFLSHIPCWMIERLFNSYRSKLFLCIFTKRTATCSYNYFAYVLSADFLCKIEYGAMFAVYRNN